ncbi:MAG TPA: lysylphosphatidylglycerol synthase domain-containing protein [Roseiarcus sp.]|nr:lysylphosphatidylglycerol synthase domain-containing protein [Roseiarcus sp.]
MALRNLNGAPSEEASQKALARLVEAVRTHRKGLHRTGVAASLIIVAVSIIIFGHTLLKIDFAQFESAFRATSANQILLAFGLASTSYLALTGYDALALRHLGAKVPYPLTALASFTSYAISFTLGFPLITGGAVRFWIYGPAGLSAGKIASLTVVAGITFWLGMGLVLASGFLFDADAIGEINHLADWANRAIGLALICVILAYLVWVTRLRRQGRGVLLHFRLPGPMLTLGQTVLGVIDVCAAAGALYVLLPKGHGVGYLAFAALYSFAAMLGIASNSPGGLGVFEATMIKGVGGSADRLLAALLLFRVVYYIVPFVAALALLGAHEAVRRWRSLSEAIEKAELEDD